MIIITIPGAMRGKGRPRFSTRGGIPRAYADAKTASAETWIRACAIEQAGATPIVAPVAVEIAILVAIPASWPKRKRAHALSGALWPTGRPDLDNCIKLIANALNGILWRDDHQIVRLVASKRYAEHAETRLTVAEV
ncbi:RusA family crossover junction endodeoxyribonuclease [Plastoroseomonas hellenica]|uniref:RusA family crossover junction endodeoxyribonuclease n=1 Tax=Plastoroseomonas hellenica TaxID=2687306 RepID=UPI001BA7784B|nr:RusA family crossover junction endodeoxyribonuclease [Plastoroseomonas hellenica]MBR0647539.1 RusA family crossover junction endodeoxyribonuclease [Plastoroseomonas hellenica]